ncbi:MAG: hypothetical protein JWP54_845 [Cryobacterium sp.]|jgi:lysophospholipase L1-like esterase|nr:hypothetical protein [Cryobacterium sp.]
MGLSGAGGAVAGGHGAGGASAGGPSAPPAQAARPLAVFLGDSYTAGAGATTASLRWSTLVAREAGWTELNQGGVGTGYDTIAESNGCGAGYCPAYVQRAMQVVKRAPDVVVVAGGQNDRPALATEPDAVRAAVNETFRLIRQGLPDARIIAVGPSTPTPATPAVTELDSWVHAAADEVDAEYVSLLAPTVIAAPMVVPDRVHVNNTGHLAIARRVLADLRAH